ncbi:trans-sialidase [Nitrosopumilus sp.]|nr:trans-sialidase [Nitrosopumilus sp.]MDB4849956.1 trans-sialidase [Nitrosopumilus sp.]
MAAAKKQTKKDLEDKIAELEAKLNQLSDQLTKKPAETKPAEVKPAETAKPKPTLPKGSTPKPQEAPKPAETAKPKPTLPKGSTPKPQEAPKEVPKPAEKAAPTTVQDALENAYMNAAMTDFHQYRAKVTGYTPAPNRYFVRGTAPVGKIPTKNWNDQKATVTGYTQPSNQYFATRPRLAYHPAEKRFGSFSGVDMTVDGLSVQTKPKEAPKLTPKEAEKLAKESYAAEMKAQGKGSLPKGF